MADSIEDWQCTMEKGIRGVFPGVSKVLVSAGGGCYPQDMQVSGLINRMLELKADEVLLERSHEKLLVVKYDYGDMFAAITYENGLMPADLSRLIQLMFARRKSLRNGGKALVPLSDIETLTRKWEKKIGLVFGRDFSKRLVEKAFTGKDKNAMLSGELESVRAYISSELGDCLHLDKVDK